MKKIIASLLALTALCAAAELPERAQKMVPKQRTVWFYNEMDRFIEEFPDVTANIEYSCSPNGNIFYGRRLTGNIDFPPLYTEQQVRPALDRIKTVIDSVYNMRQEDYVCYKTTGSWSRITDRHSNRASVYRFASHKNAISGEFEITDAMTSFHPDGNYIESGGFITNDGEGDDGTYSIMQEIFTSAGEKAKPADMSAIKDFYAHMPKPKNGRADKKTKSSKDWHRIYDLFLDRLWTGEAITLNYSRALRTVTLTDLTTDTTYTATYRNDVLSLTIAPAPR